MSIYVGCGEVSGDLHAAALIEALRPLVGEHDEIWGMLGPRGVAAGGNAVWNYEELKLMGIVEVIPAIPRLLRLRESIAREIMARRPEAVVVVDSPDFHISLVKRLRSLGYRGAAVFLVTPTVWAWRGGRTKWLKSLFDLCLPLFSFEHEFLLGRGVNSKWKAHPLVDGMAGFTPPPSLVKQYSDCSRSIIAMMPGSRQYDVRNHIDALVGAARLLAEDGFTPVFSIAPGLSEPLKALIRDRAAAFDVWEGEGRALMAVSSAVVGVSGTVAVEAMLLRRFMVVIYKVHGLSWLIARALVRVPFISMPNYLAGRQVFPELLNERATPDEIAGAVSAYLGDPSQRAEADSLLDAARDAMGGLGASKFWASEILNVIKLQQQEAHGSHEGVAAN
ncbi:MAG: lipid-A-disaccharide synthase [Synergistaceae bacterium]|jgi:lipid-A-disaccharide synthase|nr:lipid-A-disaccharide synthase [Synergistaceae bacterium]